MYRLIEKWAKQANATVERAKGNTIWITLEDGKRFSLTRTNGIYKWRMLSDGGDPVGMQPVYTHTQTQFVMSMERYVKKGRM